MYKSYFLMSSKEELIQSLKNVFTGKNSELASYCTNTITEVYVTFDKIRNLFILLNNIMKYMIVFIDDPKYQEIRNKPVVFPDTEDKLICIVGMYHKAFSPDINELLYEIINHDKFADLYKIAIIPQALMSSVVDDTIDFESLQRDSDEFAALVKILSIDVLKIGIDFESSIIEDTSDQPEYHDTAITDMKHMVAEEVD
jgi:hypothetical protein